MPTLKLLRKTEFSEQAYEAYFAQLTPDDIAEEAALLNDFAAVDAERNSLDMQ